NGYFDIAARGELVLGTRSFGLVGEFRFRVNLDEKTDALTGVKVYRFGVRFDADVSARLFGFSFAGIGLSASLTAEGSGRVDLVARVTVRIKILFVKVSKTVRFKIGTVQLPTAIYL